MERKSFCEPQDFEGSDAHRIQLAVDEAERTGKNTVIIPRLTPEGKTFWEIDKTILLPSNITLILDNCCLKMADGVICRMMMNSLAETPEGKRKENVQKNIHIIGRGNAVLSGGNDNGLNERTSRTNGMPSVWENLTIYFHNVENFSVEGITVKDQRWWAMAFMYARFGRIENINFELSGDLSEMGWWKNTWRNQDGIDLRVGCNNISISNITGRTGDDVIALTALNGLAEREGKVEGLSTDIHDVSIKNVFATCVYCAIVRLLNHQRNRIYNIVMDNIHEPGEGGVRAQTAVRMGDYGYAAGKEEGVLIRHGELFNISISNMFVRSMVGIQVDTTVKNLYVNNLFLTETAQHIMAFGTRGSEKDIITQFDFNVTPHYTKAENVTVENICYEAEHKNIMPPEALFVFQNIEAKNFKIKNLAVNNEIEIVKEYNSLPQKGEQIVFE